MIPTGPKRDDLDPARGIGWFMIGATLVWILAVWTLYNLYYRTFAMMAVIDTLEFYMAVAFMAAVSIIAAFAIYRIWRGGGHEEMENDKPEEKKKE